MHTELVTWLAKRSTVTARNEVILSSGTIGTPQILMLSGIGDRRALQPLDIHTLVDLPDERAVVVVVLSLLGQTELPGCGKWRLRDEPGDAAKIGFVSLS